MKFGKAMSNKISNYHSCPEHQHIERPRQIPNYHGHVQINIKKMGIVVIILMIMTTIVVIIPEHVNR